MEIVSKYWILVKEILAKCMGGGEPISKARWVEGQIDRQGIKQA